MLPPHMMDLFELREAARDAGLEEREIEAAIESGDQGIWLLRDIVAETEDLRNRIILSQGSGDDSDEDLTDVMYIEPLPCAAVGSSEFHVRPTSGRRVPTSNTGQNLAVLVALTCILAAGLASIVTLIW